MNTPLCCQESSFEHEVTGTNDSVGQDLTPTSSSSHRRFVSLKSSFFEEKTVEKKAHRKGFGEALHDKVS
jgi:hypothetical protein